MDNFLKQGRFFDGMVVIQHKSKRKASGGTYKKSYRSKRLYETGNHAISTTVGKKDLKVVRTKGGSAKIKTMRADKANIFDPSTKKCTVATLKSVVDNPANRHYARRNIITKGTVIDTDAGKAKVTSRPGQQGSINAVLIS